MCLHLYVQFDCTKKLEHIGTLHPQTNTHTHTNTIAHTIAHTIPHPEPLGQ